MLFYIENNTLIYITHLLAFIFGKLALIRAVEELPIKQLNSNDSEDELKQDVHNEDIDDVLQWVDHTIKYCLELGHTFDSFEWTQNSQNSEGFNSWQVLSCFASAVIMTNISLGKRLYGYDIPHIYSFNFSIC